MLLALLTESRFPVLQDIKTELEQTQQSKMTDNKQHQQTKGADITRVGAEGSEIMDECRSAWR